MNQKELTVFDVCSSKETNGWTWEEIAYILNSKLGQNLTESAYRKLYKKLLTNTEDKNDINSSILQLKKEKVKIADERNQNRAYIRRLAREDTIKEIAQEAAAIISQSKADILPCSQPSYKPDTDKEAILEISDWHYGIICDNAWNQYNPEIAKIRINSLLEQTIKWCTFHKVKKLHIFNLADLIAGRIHLTLRLESRFDVITQIMEISEILAEFITKLKKYLGNEVEIFYYECTDNHSRLEPNKADSLNLETLSRITSWYLKERLKFLPGITFEDNKYGEDIITANILGHNVAAIHGDKDPLSKGIDSISMMTRTPLDLLCTAHMHHFSADEKNMCVVVANGSLMGTDTYAKNLRLSSRPSQNLIVATSDNITYAIHRMLVD